MMSILFSDVVNPAFKAPFSSFSYRDIGTPAFSNAEQIQQSECSSEQKKKQQEPAGPSTQEIHEAINRARAEAVTETEQRLQKDYEVRSVREAAKIQQAIERFLVERKNYFSRVESDVIDLVLAIAGKILHREAQVDPMLVAALVRVAVDKMQGGSNVSVRVSPAKAEKWREYFANPLNGEKVVVMEDANLSLDDCILKTDLGSANFSIDAQLKEVEQGFADLLAQRPSVK
jgi:flagellar assembly protein FliH